MDNLGFYKDKIDDIISIELNLDGRFHMIIAFNVSSLNDYKNSIEYITFSKKYGDLITINKPLLHNEYQPVASINYLVYNKKDEDLNTIFKPLIFDFLNLVDITPSVFNDLLRKIGDLIINEKYKVIDNVTIFNDFESNNTSVYYERNKLKVCETKAKDYFYHRDLTSNTDV